MKPYIETEVILGAWSRRVETSAGVTDGYLKLFLPDDAALDVLARLPDDALRGGKKAGGKLFVLKLFEYAEGETLQEIIFEAPPEAAKLSNVAAIICKDVFFADYCKVYLKQAIWLMQDELLWIWENTTEEKLAALVRFVCSIKSRKELDTDEPAANIFKTMIEQPFNKYKAEKNEP